MFVEPMGQTPHTDVASLTVECANPLANHRLECTLDAIRGFAFGVERRRGDLSCLTVGAENLLPGTLAEPERLRHPPHGVLRGDRWPLSTFLIEIFLQLHDKLTFPHINSLTLRHRVVSWRASIRHSCETTISGYTTYLFGAKSCETRYRTFEFISLSFWYDVPLTSQDSDRRHDSWQVYRRGARPPSNIGQQPIRT